MKKIFDISGIKSIFAAVLIMGMTQANAAMAPVDNGVVYESVGFISDSGNISESFQIDYSGTYQATLIDFEFPEEFSVLRFSVVTAAEEMGRVSEEGSFIFDADPGTYYANLFAWTGEGLELGLYGVQISMLDDLGGVSPVPLPTPIVLLTSALVVFFGFGRGARRVSEIETGEDGLVPA